MNICKICEKKFLKEAGLHLHVRSHSISLESYYHKFFPRYDLYSGELIIFRNKESYFNTNFNTNKSFRLWLKEKATREEAANEIKETIVRRVERKKILNLMGAAEIDSVPAPFPLFLDIKKYLTINGYKEIISDLSCNDRFNYNKFPAVDLKEDLKILIDTREQNPISFKFSEFHKLDVGDYTCRGEDYSNIFIERKSADDFLSSFSSNLYRFYKEIERSEALGVELYILVEKPILELKTYRPKFCDSKIIKTALSNMRQISQNFTNVQFVFIEREKMRKTILTLLSGGQTFKNIDLQYYFNYVG